VSSSSIISKAALMYQQSLAVWILHPSTTHRRWALEQTGNNEHHNELLLQLENCKHRLCRRLRKKKIQQELNGTFQRIVATKLREQVVPGVPYLIFGSYCTGSFAYLLCLLNQSNYGFLQSFVLDNAITSSKHTSFMNTPDKVLRIPYFCCNVSVWNKSNHVWNMDPVAAAGVEKLVVV
jgi:hypothetical protein